MWLKGCLKDFARWPAKLFIHILIIPLFARQRRFCRQVHAHSRSNNPIVVVVGNQAFFPGAQAWLPTEQGIDAPP